MPSWMSALHKKFCDMSTHTNVQLFIAKLIVNEPTVSRRSVYDQNLTPPPPPTLPHWDVSKTGNANRGLERATRKLFNMCYIWQTTGCWFQLLCWQIFQPYAKFWLSPLMELLLSFGESDRAGTAGLNYFVVDLLVTMLSWSPTAIPEVGVAGLTSISREIKPPPPPPPPKHFFLALVLLQNESCLKTNGNARKAGSITLSNSLPRPPLHPQAI